MKSASEYRHQSREALRGNWGLAIAIMIVYGIITSLISSTLIAGIILNGVFSVGLAFTFMQFYRRGSFRFEDIFQGFNQGDFVSTIVLNLLTGIFTFLWSLLFIIPGIVAAYKYAMAPYILADHPDLSGSDAITASKNLMAGKKGRLFCLYFSFIGWDILSIFTFGILQIWLIPWKKAAEVAFYEDIKFEVAPAKSTF